MGRTEEVLRDLVDSVSFPGDLSETAQDAYYVAKEHLSWLDRQREAGRDPHA